MAFVTRAVPCVGYALAKISTRSKTRHLIETRDHKGDFVET